MNFQMAKSVRNDISRSREIRRDCSFPWRYRFLSPTN